jgi:hypothetical protein
MERFATSEALVAQIHRDVVATERALAAAG